MDLYMGLGIYIPRQKGYKLSWGVLSEESNTELKTVKVTNCIQSVDGAL